MSFEEKYSPNEQIVIFWLLGIYSQISSRKNTIVPVLSAQSTGTTFIKSVNASYLANELWKTILAYLDLQDRSKISHISKMWHYLTQNFYINQTISPIRYINKMGMSYLLIYNCRKRTRFLLTAEELTPERIKKLVSNFHSLYVLYIKGIFQKEQFFYISENQFVQLASSSQEKSKQDLRRFHELMHTYNLKYEKLKNLSAYELEIIKSITNHVRYNQLPTIECLREKIREAVCDKSANDFDRMKALFGLPIGNDVSKLLKLTAGTLLLNIFVMLIGCKKSPENLFSTENCNILDNFLIFLLILACGLSLLILTATRSRCARSIERQVEKITDRFFSTNNSPHSLRKLERDLKEYVIPPSIRQKIYMWKCAEAKNITNVQVVIDKSDNLFFPKKNQ